MKCPKCSYLGFETGDRCKNCGYDFSLIGGPSPIDEPDIDLHPPSSESNLSAPAPWDDNFDRVPATPVSIDRKLPLFAPAYGLGGLSDDEPLIKLPATPRAPLAVRRTPDTPRLRAVPKPSRPIASAPALSFNEDEPAVTFVDSAAEVRARTAALLAPPLPRPPQVEVSAGGPRLAAATVDLLLLSAIDLTVVYFTVRMAGLTMTDWTALPPVPLIAFLLLVKFSYFCAFTAVGGQTIGKMAARIRVVTTEGATVDGARAIQRTLASMFSAAPFGLGYLPALIGSERRAFHDRVTGTRVIALPSL